MSRDALTLRCLSCSIQIEITVPQPRNQKHSDASSPLILSIHELDRRAGSMREVATTLPAPDQLANEVIHVEQGSPLSLQLRLEAVTEGVFVSGEVRATAVGECARCLRPITEQLSVSVAELYAYPESTTDSTTEEDEVYRLVGEVIDLDPAVRDAVVLALPASPLCRDDCQGLCPQCGQHWEDLPADHSHEQLDPRWASLRGLGEKLIEPPE